MTKVDLESYGKDYQASVQASVQSPRAETKELLETQPPELSETKSPEEKTDRPSMFTPTIESHKGITIIPDITATEKLAIYQNPSPRNLEQRPTT